MRWRKMSSDDCLCRNLNMKIVSVLSKRKRHFFYAIYWKYCERKVPLHICRAPWHSIIIWSILVVICVCVELLWACAILFGFFCFAGRLRPIEMFRLYGSSIRLTSNNCNASELSSSSFLVCAIVSIIPMFRLLFATNNIALLAMDTITPSKWLEALMISKY